MSKEVIISVKGTQTDEYGQVETQELVTVGTYYMKNGAYFIMYNESEVTGMSGTTTFLKAERERVTLNRTGTSEQRQIFEPGRKHMSNYVTPYGTMHISVKTSKVEVNLTDIGGSIKLEYELEVGDQKISDNRLSLTVREA